MSKFYRSTVITQTTYDGDKNIVAVHTMRLRSRTVRSKNSQTSTALLRRSAKEREREGDGEKGRNRAPRTPFTTSLTLSQKFAKESFSRFFATKTQATVTSRASATAAAALPNVQSLITPWQLTPDEETARSRRAAHPRFIISNFRRGQRLPFVPFSLRPPRYHRCAVEQLRR